ncbi:HAMP domain-containing histidine kinase [Roseomonas sp. OT10]|uniref:sensor histidine kinase n=1 Tax=Roseomonas cutis TaxID=2897332 RepID=UPI001E320D1F|nr:HAMP domain-containing sensor histidine kinase [Roseomonas sp. OT10]UFN50112.1 HAMP domain-containing histidine kinase [Roseomonas sp. OT10]
MNLPPALVRRRASFLALGAVIAFILFFVMAGLRLIEVERNVQTRLGESVLWFVSQAQVETARMLDTVTRRYADDPEVDEEEVMLRFDVLVSRLSVLESGTVRERLEDLGEATELDRRIGPVVWLASLAETLTPGDRDAVNALRGALAPLLMQLRDTANRSVLADREQRLLLRDGRRRAMLEFVVFGSGIAGMGVLLIVLLVQGRVAARRAEISLERERDLGRLYRGFVSVVSHQFRTPLAIIDGSAQRMARRGTAMDAQELAERTAKIRDASRRMVRLMESTLNAARLEAGEITLNPRPCEPAVLVREICASQTELDGKARLELDLAGLPPVLPCDVTLVEQAIANLVSNAVKYSPPGSPVVVTGGSTVGGGMVLRVRDHGVGIPAGELPRLFDRFYRASTARNVPGTGIGLAFARQVARLHGGDITVESREGEGSTFTLRLEPVGDPARSGAAKRSLGWLRWAA